MLLLIVITNPRSAHALSRLSFPFLSRNSDKCSLVAANMSESKKEKEHEAMVEKYGLGFLDFNKCGVAFESSGAFGKTAKMVWSRLKFLADEADLDNYVIAEKPYTWTAFTFEQMFPQRVSWIIMIPCDSQYGADFMWSSHFETFYSAAHAWSLIE